MPHTTRARARSPEELYAILRRVVEAVLLVVMPISLFMGIGAISVEQGLMNDAVPEILTDRALARMSRSVTVLADVVHAFPTYGEALETALRELAGTGASAVRPSVVGRSAVMADQQEKGTGPLSEQDIETPEDDALEQNQELIPDETVVSVRREVPFDVNEADAAEQERAVGYDDDDYR